MTDPESESDPEPGADGGGESPPQVAAGGENIHVRRYDVTTLRDLTHWDSLSKGLRKAVLERLPPTDIGHTSNVTCIRLHEYVALVLTLEARDKKTLAPIEELAFGDDASSFDTGDTALNNEVGERINITDASASGATLSYNEYLSANEQNGNTLSEIGVFSEDGELYQHAPLSQDYEKDNSFELIISGSLTIGDA